MVIDLSFSATELTAIWLSLAVAGASSLLSLPLAIAIAYVLARGRFFGRMILDGLMHLPLVVPPVVTGFLLLVLFGRSGPIGSWLESAFGFRLVFTTYAAVLATMVMTLPLMIRQIRLSIDAIDPRLEQAAASLGAGAFDRFRTITLPLMMPGIISGLILSFSAGLGEFGAVITFAASIPGETRTIPLEIFADLQATDGEAAAWRLALVAIGFGLCGLVLAEWAARRLASRIRGSEGRPGP